MSTPSAPETEPEIVPGTSRPIPVDPDIVPTGDPHVEPETEPR
jgi:hypothetical protein